MRIHPVNLSNGDEQHILDKQIKSEYRLKSYIKTAEIKENIKNKGNY